MPAEVVAARDLLAVFARQEDVEALRPDFAKVRAPRAGIDEDPVTGSAHCTLVPYWSRRLGKPELHALQVSRRGGELFCRDHGERVAIAGRAFEYLRGEITI